MEYQNLVLYPNVYPSIDSYGRTLDGTFAIAGKYEKDNVKRYGLPKLNELVAVENTSFKFILAIKESDAVDETQYFTSEIFFNDLLASIAENNPYFINNAINPNLFVKISLDNQKRFFNDLKLIDLATGVKQNQNIFLLSDNSVDYITLVQYIDWVISKTNPLDDENNGVLPAEKISDYELGKYDPKTGEFTPDSAKTVALANRLQLLLEELADLEEAIAGISNDIPAEPKKRKTSALDVISLGLGALSVFQGVKAATDLAKGIKAVNIATKAAKEAAAVTTALQSLQPGPALQLTASPSYTSVFNNVGNSSIGFSSGAVSVGAGVSSATNIVSSTTSAGTAAAKEITKQAAEKAALIKRIYGGAKTGITAAGKAVGSAGAFVGKSVAKGSQLIVKATASPVGQTILAGAGSSAAALATANIKEERTKAILGAVTKTAAIEVGKVVVKAVAKKIAGAAIGKLIGAATGPIGAGIMAAVGIVKFFVGKAKEKKEYNKQKAEYDKVTSELERLLKRKDDVEFEIQNIMKSGKLTSDGKPKGNERFSATQKYFQNIGKNILERQQQYTQTQPQLQPIPETIEQPIIRNPGRPMRSFRNLGR